MTSEPVSLRELVAAGDWSAFWLGATAEPNVAGAVGRGLLWTGMLVLSLRFATHAIDSNVVGDSFLHLVNLVFHEAGHFLFAWGGRFLMVLGGSLNQLLVPLVCAIALRRYDDVFGGSVTIWWFGQSLVDLAPYINDARALQLVLLGGRTGAEVEGHDWEFLLQSLDLMMWDHTLARMAHVGGLLVMLAALIWGAMVIARTAGVGRGHTAQS